VTVYMRESTLHYSKYSSEPISESIIPQRSTGPGTGKGYVVFLLLILGGGRCL
jgi:hypothetical protein